jgi:hypothetical protein
VTRQGLGNRARTYSFPACTGTPLKPRDWGRAPQLRQNEILLLILDALDDLSVASIDATSTLIIGLGSDRCLGGLDGGIPSIRFRIDIGNETSR